MYWVFSTLSILDSLKLAKYLSVGYVQKGNLYRYTIMSHKILRVIIRTYFTYAMFYNRDTIGKLQKTIDSMKNTMTRNVNKRYSNTNNNQENLILVSILTLTLLGSFVATIFGFASITSGWSFVNVFTDKSAQMASVVFLWTSNVTAAEEIEDHLIEQHGENISCMSVLFGVSWIVLELFGRLYDSVVTDILLFTILTMHKLTKDFEFEKTSPIEVKSHAEMVWRHYRQLRQISEEIDSTFGSIFKWIHVSNLFARGYYLSLLTNSAGYDTYFLLLTFNILKILLVYLTAAKASHKNKAFRKWVQRTYAEQPSIIVGATHLTTCIILDELATKPLGLGSDNFHVDESFVMKVSAAGKYDERKKRMQNSDGGHGK
ncbi:unnamed protein product [Orchesella dallaii]|uniref:Gustatory receptor n=1 Tax=Orchesella dallaii TaxID=48710 RepID=A0ABP1S936_9HEXA